MKFDDRPVPTPRPSQKVLGRPGQAPRVAKAAGTVNGFPATFDEESSVKEKEFITVRITLKPPANGHRHAGPNQVHARGEEPGGRPKCLPQNRKNSSSARRPTCRALLGHAIASPSTRPGINASRAVSPTAGWNVGGNLHPRHGERGVARHRVDGVAAFRENRYGGALTADTSPASTARRRTVSLRRRRTTSRMTGGLAPHGRPQRQAHHAAHRLRLPPHRPIWSELRAAGSVREEQDLREKILAPTNSKPASRS